MSVRYIVSSLGFTAAMIGGAVGTHAQIPVTDVANTTQSIQQVINSASQLTEMVAQGQQLVAQIELMEAEIEALTSLYEFGDFANTAEYKELRRLGDLGDTLSILSGEATGIIASLGNEHLETYGLAEGPAIFSPSQGGAENPLTVAHDASREAIAAGAGTSRAILAGMDRRIDTYEGLIAEIDATPTAKASADLGARISAENGLLMNEVLRLLAVNLELQQTMLARELANDQADSNFFNPESGG